MVDNGSTNAADVEQLVKLIDGPKPIHLLLGDRNLGYFAGLDLGLQYLQALRNPWDAVIVGNNDVTFPSDLIMRLDYYRRLLQEWPIVSPALVDDSGQHQNPHVARPITRLRRSVWKIYHRNYLAARTIAAASKGLGSMAARCENDGNHPFHFAAGEIEQGYGAAYLLGERFFEEFARLPVLTFMMQEEFFLSELLRHHGTAIYYDPALIIRHHTHGSLGSFPARSRWQLARDAYAVYEHYLSLPPAHQKEMLAAGMRQRTFAGVTVLSNCS